MSILTVFLMILLTIFFIVILYPIAIKVGLTDRPNHRKQHKTPTPLIGGLACYLSILLVLLVVDNIFPHQYAYISASTLLVVVGLWDDYKGLGVRFRFIAQIIAVLIMIQGADLKIADLGYLTGFGSLRLEAFATVFTVFAVVGGINAFNMIDGIDGLAGGLVWVSLATLAAIACFFQNNQLCYFSLLLMATATSFLLFNLRILGRSNAKIFLGDTGSTFFGFTICWLIIYASQSEQPLMPPALVLWIIALPLLDSICIMMRRFAKGRSPFAADREHLHHILLLAGFSVNQVVFMLLMTALLLSTFGIGIAFVFDYPDEILLVLFLVFFCSYFWCMEHAWKMMKIARYLRTKHGTLVERTDDRRKGDRRVSVQVVAVERRVSDRRTSLDRRYVPTPEEINSVYKKQKLIRKLLLNIN